MSNAILGWPIYSDVGVTYTPVLWGGSWVAGLPLSNLQDRELAKVARSTDAALTSTIIKADLGVARSVRLIAGVAHNLTAAAAVRVRGFAAEPLLEDNAFNGWNDLGTPVATTGQADPFGGTRAVLLNDNDAGVVEAKYRSVSFTGTGTKGIAVAVKTTTATVSDLKLYDNTAAQNRMTLRLTWSAGVPSGSLTAGAGAFAIYALGDGWYVVVMEPQSVVGANANAFYLYPGGENAAETGALYAYEFMAWDLASPVTSESGLIAAWPSGVATAEDYDGYTRTFIKILGAAATAQCWRIEVADTANPDGYVQMGRLALCGGWEPTNNFAPGQKLGFETSTSEEETDGGPMVVRERANRRVAVMTFQDLPKDEALANALDMQARLGRYGQLFAVLDPDDASNLHRQSFLARLKELSALEHPYYQRRHVPFALVEEL